MSNPNRIKRAACQLLDFARANVFFFSFFLSFNRGVFFSVDGHVGVRYLTLPQMQSRLLRISYGTTLGDARRGESARRNPFRVFIATLTNPTLRAARN